MGGLGFEIVDLSSRVRNLWMTKQGRCRTPRIAARSTRQIYVQLGLLLWILSDILRDKIDPVVCAGCNPTLRLTSTSVTRTTSAQHMQYSLEIEIVGLLYKHLIYFPGLVVLAFSNSRLSPLDLFKERCLVILSCSQISPRDATPFEP